MATVTIKPETIQLLRISDEEYFSEKYKKYISNSKLGLINPTEGGSIEKFKEGFKSSYSDSFEVGSAVHAMILQKGEYELSKITKPTGKLGVFADKVWKMQDDFSDIDELYKAASIEADYYAKSFTETRLLKALEQCNPYWEERRELKEELLEKPQIILSEPNLFKAESCIANLQNNKKVIETLFPESLLGNIEIYNEYTLICEADVEIDGKITTVLLKGKLDNFIVNHETQELILNDLKTTGKPVSFFMGNWVDTPEGKVWYNGSFQTYHYYRQAAMYLWILSAWHKYQGHNYSPKSNIVVVETFPEFQTKVYKIYNKHIKQGLDEFKQLLIEVVKWT